MVAQAQRAAMCLFHNCVAELLMCVVRHRILGRQHQGDTTIPDKMPLLRVALLPCSPQCKHWLGSTYDWYIINGTSHVYHLILHALDICQLQFTDCQDASTVVFIPCLLWLVVVADQCHSADATKR